MENLSCDAVKPWMDNRNVISDVTSLNQEAPLLLHNTTVMFLTATQICAVKLRDSAVTKLE